MRQIRVVVSLTAALAAAALAGPVVTAQAFDDGETGPAGAVFVQTNDPAANSVVAYVRHSDGTTTQTGTFATGGRGGRELSAVSDPIASQGSLVFDPPHQLLLAVNAGSDSISVFRADGDRLRLLQVLPSGGPFPASIAVHGNLVYVVDTGLAGYVSGFEIEDGGLQPIPGSTRTLGLANSNPPFFLKSTGQVGFTPDGEHLLVTTKLNGTVEAFQVGEDGQLSAQPTRNVEGPVPFAFTFSSNVLVLNTAGNSAAGAFHVNDDGTLTPVSAPVSDTQAAACWIIPARGFDYVANTASGDLSQYRVSENGALTLVNPTATAPSSIPGATDLATADGRFLYVISGTSGSFFAYRIAGDGSLSLIQTQPVPDGASLEGIVAG